MGAVVDGSGVAAIATGGTAVVEGLAELVVDVSDSEVVVTAASARPGTPDGEAGAAEVVVVPSDTRVVVVPLSFRGSPTWRENTGSPTYRDVDTRSRATSSTTGARGPVATNSKEANSRPMATEATNTMARRGIDGLL